jgi:hypothetical protein
LTFAARETEIMRVSSSPSMRQLSSYWFPVVIVEGNDVQSRSTVQWAVVPFNGGAMHVHDHVAATIFLLLPPSRVSVQMVFTIPTQIKAAGTNLVLSFINTQLYVYVSYIV